MTADAHVQLRAWLQFYDELGLTPLIRHRSGEAIAAQRIPARIPTGEGAPAPVTAPRSAEIGRAIPAAGIMEPVVAAAAGESSGARAASLFDSGGPKGDESLGEIQSDLGECTRCKLHEGRTNIVFGAGNPKAKLVFVGEGPGADEDAQGVPFVGRAGRLLNKWIESIGLARDDVYICNVVKCRPPGNRAPEKDEAQACDPFLFRQLEAIRPKLVCCLGATALKALLGKTVAIGKMRGQFLDFRGTKMLPLYHPAYLLRPHGPKVDKDLKQDLKTIRDFLDL